MDVSIIIVTYNTCKMTNECINSIVQYTIGLEYEIILVDNASQDDSYNTFSHDERVHYIYNDKNLGFGKANNVGAKHATGRYLFLLNSDTLLKNNAIGYFVEFMDSSPQNIGCCGTLLTDAKGGSMHSFGDAHTIFNTLDEWCVFPVLSHIGLRNQLSKYYCRTIPDIYFFEVGFVTGADMFIRREAYEKCGLFDPDFFMYYEDAELCARYRKNGFRSVIIKKPSIVHLEGASNKNNSLAKRGMVMKSMFLYFKKNLSSYSFCLFKVLFKILYIMMFLTCLPFVNGNIKEKRKHLVQIIKL